MGVDGGSGRRRHRRESAVPLRPLLRRDDRAGLRTQARRDRAGVRQRLFGGGRKRLLHVRLGILQAE